MGMRPVDALIVIKYGFNGRRSESCVYTNARPEALEELLDTWIQDQVGTGRDPNPPNEALDLYTIDIGYFLDVDAFSTESDTSNRGLSTGIVMAVVRELREGTLSVKGLEELPK